MGLTVTKGKDWRDSNPYRKEYFRKNPGIGKVLWICSQCYKPLWGKDSVEVDHIIPPSIYAKKVKHRDGTVSNTSMRSEALNQTYNLVAICSKCNKTKSAKTGSVTYRGYFAKVMEVIVFKLQDGVFLAGWGGKKVLSATVGELLPENVKRGKPTNTKPDAASRSIIMALIAFLLFILVFLLRLVVKAVKKFSVFGIKGAFRVVFAPLRSRKTAWYIKLLVVGIYVGLGWYLWKKVMG